MKLLSILILTTAMMLACEKKQSSTTTGNPLVSLNMASSAQSTAVVLQSIDSWLFKMFFAPAIASQPPAMTDLNGNTVNLDAGWMAIREIEFEVNEVAGVDEVDGAGVEFPGPYVVNLFSATPDQIGKAQVAATSIRRIKMKLSKLESSLGSSPNELLNNSVYFHGSVGAKSFSIASADGSEFQVGGPTALNTYDNMNILLSIKIVPLIAKINLSYLLTQADPIVISDTQKYDTGTNICPSIDSSATTIYDCFRKGIEQQASLGDDQDGSGEIESNEHEVDDH